MNCRDGRDVFSFLALFLCFSSLYGKLYTTGGAMMTSLCSLMRDAQEGGLGDV